jgi:hypothetical protein
MGRNVSSDAESQLLHQPFFQLFLASRAVLRTETCSMLPSLRRASQQKGPAVKGYAARSHSAGARRSAALRGPCYGVFETGSVV